MRGEYDFTVGEANPYIQTGKTTITIQIDNETAEYFKTIASEANLPYQALMNFCLADYARKRKKPQKSRERRPEACQ